MLEVVSVTEFPPCTACDGVGYVTDGRPGMVRCAACDGAGNIPPAGAPPKCPRCGGCGHVDDSGAARPCPWCEGDGVDRPGEAGSPAAGPDGAPTESEAASIPADATNRPPRETPWLTASPPGGPLPGEAIDHPPHYGGRDSPHEHIKIIEALGHAEGFCWGNCLKYLMRAGRKPGAAAVVDYKKARWYLDRLIQGLEAEDGR